MNRIGSILKKINLKFGVQSNVPLDRYTTFQTGGPADFFLSPASIEESIEIFRVLHSENIPYFILGKGANLLVSDRGIRGVVIYTGELNQISQEGSFIKIQGGLDVSSAIEWCQAQGLSSLEFMYGMPSSVGGAIFMNARCYGHEIADVFEKATIVLPDGKSKQISFVKDQWDYKISPFQKTQGLITEGWFRWTPMDSKEIKTVMDRNYLDRESKGHFRAPSAGSIFKNNHDFGEPSGVLIDRCGLKGLTLGQAMVSLWHGNIIINNGGATSNQIKSLITQVKQKVHEKLGFLMEEEVIYAGDWPDMA